MAETIAQLLNESNTIRTEEVAGQNTAGRVGGLFTNIVQWLDDNVVKGGTIPRNLSDLRDVKTEGASNGNFLKYDGSDWVPSSGGADGRGVSQILYYYRAVASEYLKPGTHGQKDINTDDDYLSVEDTGWGEERPYLYKRSCTQYTDDEWEWGTTQLENVWYGDDGEDKSGYTLIINPDYAIFEEPVDRENPHVNPDGSIWYGPGPVDTSGWASKVQVLKSTEPQFVSYTEEAHRNCQVTISGEDTTELTVTIDSVSSGSGVTDGLVSFFITVFDADEARYKPFFKVEIPIYINRIGSRYQVVCGDVEETIMTKVVYKDAETGEVIRFSNLGDYIRSSELNMSKLTTDIQGVSEDVRTLTSEFNQTSSAITMSVSANTESISGLTKTTADLTIEADRIAGVVSGQTQSISGITNQMSEVEMQLSGITTTVSAQTDTISGLTEDVSHIIESSSAITAEVKSLEKRVPYTNMSSITGWTGLTGDCDESIGLIGTGNSMYSQQLELKPGTYTFSAYMRGFQFRLETRNSPSGSETIDTYNPVATEETYLGYTRYYFTFTLATVKYVRINLHIPATGITSVAYRPQLEVGGTMTAYVPDGTIIGNSSFTQSIGYVNITADEINAGVSANTESISGLTTGLANINIEVSAITNTVSAQTQSISGITENVAQLQVATNNISAEVSRKSTTNFMPLLMWTDNNNNVQSADTKLGKAGEAYILYSPQIYLTPGQYVFSGYISRFVGRIELKTAESGGSTSYIPSVDSYITPDTIQDDKYYGLTRNYFSFTIEEKEEEHYGARYVRIILLIPGPSGTGVLYRPQLEVGDTPTTYSADGDSIGSTGYAQITADAVNLGIRQGLNNTGINISDGEIKLKANKVNFYDSTGTNLNPKIWLDPTSGALNAVDGNFSGTVKANNLFRTVAISAGSDGDDDVTYPDESKKAYCVTIEEGDDSVSWIYVINDVPAADYGYAFTAGQYITNKEFSSLVDAGNEAAWIDDRTNFRVCIGPADEVILTQYNSNSYKGYTYIPRCQDFVGKSLTIHHKGGSNPGYIKQVDGSVVFVQGAYMYLDTNPTSPTYQNYRISYGSNPSNKQYIASSESIVLYSTGTYWVKLSI